MSECDVPECENGWCRVPVIESRINYGYEERFVRYESVQCAACSGGMGYR